MARVRILFLTICAALVLAAAEARESYFPNSIATPAQCRTMGASRDCVLDKLGADRAEEYASSDRELIRALAWDAWANPMVVIGFEQHGQAARVTLYDLDGAGHDVTMPLTNAQWREAVDA